jgi:glycosyltransferase involved in cell wall biosynthesis
MIRLTDLPPPPPGKVGWPWTEESTGAPDSLPGDPSWPRLSIVTPSFNQAAFLEETIRSVLLQNYPHLEYILIDGGSTDGSAEIIRRYRPFLAHVISEPTRGHAAAINQGMQRATGSILAFINSDDFYLPGAFTSVAREFQEPQPADLIYGGCRFVDQASQECIEHFGEISRLEEILDFHHVWRGNREIVQPEAFWRREIFEKTGPFNTKIPGSFCYEYWCRMLIAGATFRRLDQPLACFRIQPAQRSQLERDTAHDDYLAMVRPWLWDRSVPLSARARLALQGEWLYHARYFPSAGLSASRRETKWRHWARTAWLCARHPQLLAAREFQKRWRKRIGLASPS